MIKDETPAGAVHIRAAQIKKRYGGVSDMWLARKMADHDFPAPQTFGTSERFWRVDELDAWDAQMRDRALNTPKQPIKTDAR